MRKLKLFFACLLMAVLSIGQVWATTTYEQLTSIASIDESAEYVLGIDGTGFHYEGTSSWGKTALPSAQTPIKYTLKKATDGNSFTAEATISETKYYLQIPTSNTFSMATSTGTNTDLIIGTTQVSETNYAVANKTTTARHLRINGTSGLRSYAGTTGTMAFFYKVVADTKTLTSLSISGDLTDKSYETGESLDFSGLTVTGTYSDNSQQEVTSNVEWSFTPDLAAGTSSYTVTATIGEISANMTITGVTVTAATPKITITQDQIINFTNTYAQYDWTAGGVSGKLYAYKNAGMQFNSSKTGYYVYNTNPIPGTIRKITLTATGTERTWTPYVSTTALTATDANKALTAEAVSSTTTWDVTGDNYYFYLEVSGGATVISSIVIEYETCESLAQINGSVTASQTSAVIKLAEAYSDVNNASGYQLKVVGSSNYNDWTDVAKADLTTTDGVTVNGLTCGTNYTAYLRAKGGEGYCEYGAESSVEFATSKYTISVAELTNGTITVNPETACETEQVTLTITPSTEESGYHLASWSINGTAQDVSTTSFTMPAANVTIAATFEENSAPMAINITETDKATVTSSVSSAVATTNITLSCTNIAEGYQFFGWTVMAGGNSVDVTNPTSATDASFTMPAAIVTVTADIRQMVKVTFHNGSAAAYDTKQTYVGGTITLASTPTSFDETNFPNFVGWTTSNDGLVTTIPTLVTGDETINSDADYYAVFSDAPTTTNNYKKIATTGELTDGNYLIVAYASSKYFAMKNAVQSSYYVAGTEVAPSENVVANPDATNVFAITTNADNNGGISIYSAASEKYIGMITSNNHYNLKPEETNAHYFSYAVTDGAWDITSKTYTGQKIQFQYYKSTTPEFCGEGSYTNPIYLYKQQIAATKWTTRQVAFVTISYDANGVDAQDYTGTLPASEQIESGNDYTVSTAVLSGRTGYNFIGWNTNDQATEGLSGLTNVTSDVTLHAIWQAIPTYTVTFVAGTGNTLVCASCENNALTEESSTSGVTLPSATPSSYCSQAGWSFYGWAVEAVSEASSATLVTETNGKYYPDQNRTLYAVYKVTEGASGSQKVTFSYTETTDMTTSEVNIGTNFATVSFNKGSNSSNGPKFYTDATNGNAVRCYGGNTFTVASSSEEHVTSIKLTFTAGGSNAITANCDSYDDTKGEWTGDASSVTFTVSGNSGQRRVASIEVTIGDPGTTTYDSNPTCDAPTVSAPTFDLTESNYSSAQTLHLSSTTENVTFYYNITDDGSEPDDPTTASTLYNADNGISLSARKIYTIKAIAYDANNNASSVSTATYDIRIPYTSVADLQAAATSTEKAVNVTFNDWVVTHVFTKTKDNNSNNSVYVIDDDGKGIVIYGATEDLNFAAGDKLNGTVPATLKSYSGATQLLNIAKDMQGLTTTAGTVNPTEVTDFSTLSVANQSALVTLKNATCSINDNDIMLSDGTNSIKYYDAFGLEVTPTDGMAYDITGILIKYNSTLEIAPRAAEDVATATLSEYSVISNLTGCEADENNASTVSVSAEELVLIYTLEDGYKWGTPVVTMGSETLVDNTDYTWTIEGSTGTLEIIPNAFNGAIRVTLTCKVDYGAYTFYDFSLVDMAGWGNSYNTNRELNYTDATVTIGGAAKQTSTITDVPVTKGGDVTIVLNDNTKKISEVELSCTQWSTKEQTITLWYSTDLGETYQQLDPSVTSSDFVLSVLNPNKLPSKTNAVKFTFSSNSNQVGIASVKLLIEELTTPHVTLASNDASLGTLSIQNPNESGNYDEGTQLTILSNPETGCKLESVELSEDNGGATLTTDENNNTILTVGSKAVTVTGTFARYYTVSFNTQTEDVVAPESQEVKAGETFTIPTELLTREGKVFKGWNTIATAEDGLTGEITVDEDKVLYAIWADPANCTISFYLNGTPFANETELQGTTYSVTRGLTTEQSESIPEGYTFEGWSTVPFDTYQNAFTPVTSITIPAETTLAFFAVFSRESQAAEGAGDYKKVTSTLSDWSGDYLIVYEEGGLAFNGGLTTLDAESNTISVTITDGTIDQSATVDAASFRIAANENAYSIKSKSGYYIGQTSDANGLASSTTTVYNNSMAIEDGKAEVISSGAYLCYNSASNQNRFRYYKSSSYSNQQPIQLYKKETGVTIYTTNAVEVYTITYDANGGTGTIDICTPQEIGANQSVTLCNPTLTKRGYTFAGWNTEANPTSENPGTSYTAGQENCMFTANTTLYAKWAEAESYHVTYVTSGAAGQTPTDETVYYDGDHVTLNDASGLSLDGYVFEGWRYGGQTYNAGSQDFEIHSNVTFTAVWSELAGDKYVLVTDNNLSTSKVYVIAAASFDYAMGEQKSNNRGAVVIAKKGNVLYAPANLATFTLEELPEETYAIKEEGVGYLYAASNTANQLKTESEIDENNNAKWTITISTSSDVVTASITAGQSSNRNVMKFNDSDKLFSCYASSNPNMKDLALYEKVEKYTVDDNHDGSDIPANADVVVESGQTLTLTGDKEFSGLLVEDGSTVDLQGHTLTVPEFRIEASQVADPTTGLVNPSSGQFLSPTNLSAPEASFDLRVTMNAFDWFAFAVPFQVDVTKIRFIDDDDHVVTTPNHDIIYYDEAIRATNGYSATKSPAWQYITTGNLMPGVLYMIAVDNVNFTKLRFPKAASTPIYNMPVQGNMPVSYTTTGISGQGGWNGIANPALSNIRSSADLVAQTYKGGVYESVTLNKTTFVVGTPFFVQVQSSSPIAIEEGNAEGEGTVILAPNRVNGKVVERISVELKRNGIFNDRLFVSADEDATNTYTIGRDVQKMGVSSRRAQMWVNSYNMKLCANEVPMVNNQAIYELGLYTPAAGTYSLSAEAIEGADLYVTYEGQIIWNLSLGDYELDLARGTTTGYGLLLVVQPNQMPTGVENGELLNGENGVQKILLNGQLYILRDGHLYDAVGKEMK